MTSEDGATVSAKRGPGRPRSGPDPQRFAQIIEQTAELFKAKGYAATSIQDIADAVGLLKGSVYHYVDSKEDFLFHIIQGVYRGAVDEMSEVMELDAKPEERLAAFVRAHVMFTATHLTAYTVRLREFHNLSDERRRQIRQGGQAYVDLLARILEEGQSAGVFSDEFDLDVLIRVLLGQMNSITRWYTPESSLDPEKLADHVVALTVGSVISSRGIGPYGDFETVRAHARQVTT